MRTALAPARAVRTTALLADTSRDRSVAFAAHVTRELIEHPAITTVPGAAYFAHGLLLWHGGLVPLIDLHVLLRAHAESPLRRPRYALVLAWQRSAGAPLEHGAIGLATPPRRRVVEADTPACPLPTDSDLWPYIASSCLRDDDRLCPIIDTSRLFGSSHG